jgi:NADH-quinone oxidoreductase subunit J
MSVLSLLGSFFCVAVIYLLAGFQFLAGIQILVYAGAIMVLFLFVVMLLNLGDADHESNSEPMFHQGRRAHLAIGTAVAILVAGLVAILSTELPAVDPALAELGNDPARELALAMFGRYSLPFEAASVLLIATTVGILVLAKRQRGTGAGTGTTGEGA